MAATQRAAHKTVATAEETRHRGQEHLDNANGEPAKRRPGRSPQAAASLEQVAQDVEAARQEHQRLAGQRETVTQSLRALGHADHCVDLERGVRRHGTRMADDIQEHLDTIRTMAQQEHLSPACLDWIEQAERVGPTMQATSAFVSGDVRQQGRPLHVAPPASYAVHAPLMPSFSLERVASTRTGTQGEPRRELAERLRTPLCEPGGVLGE